MNFSRRVTQQLHEEHSAALGLIEMLDAMIARAKRVAPDVNDKLVRMTLEKASAMIAHEIRHHFSFEEDELFTRLEDAGEEEICEHLRAEHLVILPLGEKVAAQARDALNGGFSDQGWMEFRTLTGDLTERLLAHIQKEEMALLPLVDELLDAATDMALSEKHAAVA